MHKPDALELPVWRPGPPPTDAEVERALEHAVRRGVGGAARVGVFLSGGLDSSLLLALARPLAEVVTFTIAGSDYHADMVAATRLAAEWGVEHHRLVPDGAMEADARSAVRRRPRAYPGDEAVWLLCRAARKHIELVLATDGIDELTGGYWWHANRSEHFPSQAAAFDHLWGRLWPDHLEPLLASAADAGLEVRLPFLNRELVGVLTRIPLAERAGDGQTKRSWKRIAARHVPAWVVGRPKIGFCDALRGSG